MTPVLPELVTRRLRLRPFREADAADVHTLLSHPGVAAGMLSIPSPYPAGLALTWIRSRPAAAEEGRAYSWAITPQDGAALLGSVTLSPDPGQGRAELGYWIGVPFWGQGHATEAVAAVLAFGFGSLGLHRIHATVFPRNAASARVLEKSGFRREGLLRGYARKDGAFEDLVMYARLRTDG
ncbi:GNAT family N-acetyltransferase [Deinococcus ficus]|uniref:GNAT family N-acetyltransferase n=1 Tax=Deinococcus ficus TaxID=317577 RepID=A0A221SXY1_9DEIO|nr:GNAT family N-acetyltransferase [Deinococcus ficus]ASN81509.1 GNAT family N-acetyltransferase [Deinococcus ficus]